MQETAAREDGCFFNFRERADGVFFLSEKEKNGFKKRFFGCGGTRKKRADSTRKGYAASVKLLRR